MEAQGKLWLTNYGLAALAKGEEFNSTHLFVREPGSDMSEHGWHLLKSFTLQSPPLPSREEAAGLSIAMLQELLRKKRVDAEAEQNLILAQISKLQSLTYEEKS